MRANAAQDWERASRGEDETPIWPNVQVYKLLHPSRYDSMPSLPFHRPRAQCRPAAWDRAARTLPGHPACLQQAGGADAAANNDSVREGSLDLIRP